MKMIIWLLTLLGLTPLLLFLSLFIRIFCASDMPVRSLGSLLDSRSWSGHSTVYQSGNRFAEPNGTEIKLYPRLGILAVGVLGAVCLIVFTVYTLHIPYK